MKRADNRSATDTIRGFLTQITLCTLRWVQADKSEIVVTEGSEDIDRRMRQLDGSEEVTQESVKALADAISARSEAVYETIANFAASHIRATDQGTKTTFVFTTTATPAKQVTQGGRSLVPLKVDILATWKAISGGDTSHQLDLIDDVRALLSSYVVANPASSKGLVSETKAAIARLDKDATWPEFFRAVVWNFDAKDLVELRSELERGVSELKADTPTGVVGSSLARPLAEGLVLEVLSRSALKDIRQRELTAQLLLETITRFLSEFNATALHLSRLRMVAWAEYNCRWLVGNAVGGGVLCLLALQDLPALELRLERLCGEVLADRLVPAEVKDTLRLGGLAAAAARSEVMRDRVVRLVTGGSAGIYFLEFDGSLPTHDDIRWLVQARLVNRGTPIRGVSFPSGLADDLERVVHECKRNVVVDRGQGWPFTSQLAAFLAADIQSWRCSVTSVNSVAAYYPRVKLLVDRSRSSWRQGDALWEALSLS